MEFEDLIHDRPVVRYALGDEVIVPDTLTDVDFKVIICGVLGHGCFKTAYQAVTPEGKEVVFKDPHVSCMGGVFAEVYQYLFSHDVPCPTLLSADLESGQVVCEKADVVFPKGDWKSYEAKAREVQKEALFAYKLGEQLVEKNPDLFEECFGSLLFTSAIDFKPENYGLINNQVVLIDL